MYYVKDMPGSIRATVESSGYVAGFEDFTPFGETMQGRSFNYGNPNDIYKFTGLAYPPCRKRDTEIGLDGIYPERSRRVLARNYDPEIGLDYMIARNYDPEIGRFFPEGTGGVDPLASKYPTLGPYAYVANNPLVNVDEDGRSITRKQSGSFSNAWSQLKQGNFLGASKEAFRAMSSSPSGADLLIGGPLVTTGAKGTSALAS